MEKHALIYKKQLEENRIPHKEIARLAKVSDKTLSVFLNEQGDISEKKAADIINAIIDSIVAKKETEKGNAKEPVSEVNFLVIEINRLTRTLPNEILLCLFNHMNALEAISNKYRSK